MRSLRRQAYICEELPHDLFGELLAASRGGDRGAFQSAFTVVYDELRALAHALRSHSRPGATLTTTVLVHETFLKLARGQEVAIQDRHHFFALAARAMRQVLVDAARARQAGKRGDGLPPLALQEIDLPVDPIADDIVALDRALERLEAVDERLARLVEARFFGGLSDAEIAELLDRNERTVRRDWAKARVFLLHELAGQGRSRDSQAKP